LRLALGFQTNRLLTAGTSGIRDRVVTPLDQGEFAIGDFRFRAALGGQEMADLSHRSPDLGQVAGEFHPKSRARMNRFGHQDVAGATT